MGVASSLYVVPFALSLSKASKETESCCPSVVLACPFPASAVGNIGICQMPVLLQAKSNAASPRITAPLLAWPTILSSARVRNDFLSGSALTASSLDAAISATVSSRGTDEAVEKRVSIWSCVQSCSFVNKPLPGPWHAGCGGTLMNSTAMVRLPSEESPMPSMTCSRTKSVENRGNGFCGGFGAGKHDACCRYRAIGKQGVDHLQRHQAVADYERPLASE